ncbi:arabinosyltransferase domain-containing protein [Actinomycetospora sp. CA-101289]|uniref:arabinosyltransferase domain-containing protein n=1 Tax=Actinomycetospora sp. CA-101289 TaxID=3239893 RepID=UPI003D97076B
MSTDAPPQVSAAPDGSPPDPSRPPRRPVPVAWVIAVVAGLTALVGAVFLPFAPVSVSTPEVSWPADPRDPAPTMLMLTAYEPADLEVRFSCRAARAAAATPDGVVLSTMGPTSRDAEAEALTVVARGDAVSVRSGGFDLWSGLLPADDCRFVVAGDAAGVRVLLDGAVVSATPSRIVEPDPEERRELERTVLPESRPEPRPVTPLPEVDALRTSVPPGTLLTADDLSVRLVLDDAFDHTPTPGKSALITLIVVALVVGAVALAVPSGRAPPALWDARAHERLARWARERATRTGVRLAGLRPRAVDVLVPAVLLAWLYLAPITDDDGYYSSMAANLPFSGYLANYYQLYNQGFTPFTWPYYALSWWQQTAGVGIVAQRVPALVLGLGTWALARAFVARTPLGGSGRWAPALARTALAAAFLAWFLPYDMGVRPEPVVGFFAIAALVAVAEALDRRRIALLGLGVGLAAAGLMAAPTGFVALAPLVAAAPAAGRLVRERATGWWSVAGSWVVVLAPLAVGSLLGFTDGAYRDFARAQEIFAPVQRVQTWYEELLRYNALFDTLSHHGSYARRAAVVACLLALVWFLVLLVAARVRDLPVPARLPLAGWSMLLALALLLPTPSKPTHHFGALAGLGAVFLTLLLVTGPRLVAALDRARRVPQTALLAVALSAVLAAALVGHGRAMWPYGWGIGMPSYGDYPSVRGIAFDQPLWWALALLVLTAAAALAAHRWARPRRRLALAVAVPVLVVGLLAVMTTWTVRDVTRAAIRTSGAWSPQGDGWTDPAATGCGLGGQIDVLDPRGARALAPADDTVPAPALDADDAPDPELRDEPFVPGAFFPASPPPPGTPDATTVWGSFLVPENGADADARTGTLATGWYRLPPAADAGVAVAVSGRTARDVSLRAEYGRATPGGFAPLGSRRIGADDPESVAWRTLPLLEEDAPPPGADVVRLVAQDDSTTTGGWLAFTAPVQRAWVPLPQYLPAGAAVGVAWQIRTYFPCLRQPRQQAGVTEPAVAAVAFTSGGDPDGALTDWTFDPTRGGLLGHAQREGPGTTLTTRVRGVGDEIDDVVVLDLRPPYDDGGYTLTRERRTVSGLPEEGVDLQPDPGEPDDLSPAAPPADG